MKTSFSYFPGMFKNTAPAVKTSEILIFEINQKYYETSTL